MTFQNVATVDVVIFSCATLPWRVCRGGLGELLGLVRDPFSFHYCCHLQILVGVPHFVKRKLSKRTKVGEGHKITKITDNKTTKVGEGRGRELLQLGEGEEGQVTISLLAFVNMK